jgi:hypothetical protein
MALKPTLNGVPPLPAGNDLRPFCACRSRRPAVAVKSSFVCLFVSLFVGLDV